MGLHVRGFRESDAANLAELYFESVRQGTKEYYSEKQREAWAPSVPDAEKLKSRLATMIVLVAEDESGIVGFMTLDETGYIDLAFVRPDRIRTGVASEIYKRIEETSKERGQTRLFSSASELAKPFFEKHGWTVSQTQQVERHGVKMTNHRMEKVFI